MTLTEFLNPSDWHNELDQVHTYLYLIQCHTKNHYYVGITGDVKKRMILHKNGNGAWFVKQHGFKSYRVLGTGFEWKKAGKLETRITAELNKAGYITCGGGYTKAESFEPKNYPKFVESLFEKFPDRYHGIHDLVRNKSEEEKIENRKLAIEAVLADSSHYTLPESDNPFFQALMNHKPNISL